MCTVQRSDRYEKRYPLILKTGVDVDRQIAKYLMWFAEFFVAFHAIQRLLFSFEANQM